MPTAPVSPLSAFLTAVGGFVAFSLAFVSSPAFAAPAKAAPAPEPSLPAPAATLKVTPGTGGGPWKIQIENAGEGPLRLTADPRLLILELTPPAPAEPVKGKPKATGPIRCILPDDARPSTDDGRELVIPAKRSWSNLIDPLFYCFGAKERAALVTGTQVKARFGWPAPTPKPGARPATANPPFVISPVGAAIGKVGPAKALESDTFTLTDAVPLAPNAGTTKAEGGATGDGDSAPKVYLTVPETADIYRGFEIGTVVSLHNQSDRAITLLNRPEMILFSVSSASGAVSCGYPKIVASPIRELFTTVGVKGRSDTGVLITAVCPAGTFDEPGLYRVTPRLDTTNASGRSLGLRTWDGVVPGRKPLLLRVRSPRKTTVPPRPTLD
jgi:hypothetical protein